MTRDEQIILLKSELARREKIRLLKSELDRRNGKQNNEPQQQTNEFSGERTLGRSVARSAKSLAAGAIGSVPDLLSAPYNIGAAVTNANKEALKNVDPRVAAMSGWGVRGGVDYIPTQNQGDVPYIPSVTEMVDTGIDKATGGYTTTPKDQKALQEGLKVGGSIFGGGLANKAIKYAGSKLGSNLGNMSTSNFVGSTKPIDLASGVAAGSAATSASENDYGVPASLAAGLAAGSLTNAALASPKNFESLKNIAAKGLGHSSENINLDTVKTSERLGLDYPVTLVNESKPLAGIEQLVQRTPIIGSKYNKRLVDIDNSYNEKIKNTLGKVGNKISESNDNSESLFEVGSSLKSTLEKTKDSVKQEKDSLYEMANKLLPENASIIPKNTIETINKIRNSIKTLRPSSDEKLLLSYLDDLEGGIVLKSDKFKTSLPVSIDMLSGTKRSLNDTINWDFNVAGVKNNLKKIQKSIKDDLAEYGKENKDWFKAYSDADSYYGKYLGDEALASDTVKKIFSQEDPEKVLLMLKETSDFRKIENSLGSSAEGKKFFDSLKREKLDNMILGKTIDPKTNEISYSSFAKMMEDPKSSTLMRYLAGEKNYKTFKDLGEYAQAMVKRARRNPNPSGTAYTNTMLGVVTGAMMGGGGIINTVKNAGKLAIVSGAISNIITNKKLLNYSVNAAKAQANGKLADAKKFSMKLDNAYKEQFGENRFRELIAISKDLNNNFIEENQ